MVDFLKGFVHLGEGWAQLVLGLKDLAVQQEILLVHLSNLIRSLSELQGIGVLFLEVVLHILVPVIASDSHTDLLRLLQANLLDRVDKVPFFLRCLHVDVPVVLLLGYSIQELKSLQLGGNQLLEDMRLLLDLE